MKSGTCEQAGAEVRYSILTDGHGRWMQFYYTIVPRRAEPIAD